MIPKIIIEIEGGVLQQSYSTNEMEIFIVDHDNLKAGEEVEKTQMPSSPDVIFDDALLKEKLNDLLEPYKLTTDEHF